MSSFTRICDLELHIFVDSKTVNELISKNYHLLGRGDWDNPDNFVLSVPVDPDEIAPLLNNELLPIIDSLSFLRKNEPPVIHIGLSDLYLCIDLLTNESTGMGTQIVKQALGCIQKLDMELRDVLPTGEGINDKIAQDAVDIINRHVIPPWDERNPYHASGIFFSIDGRELEGMVFYDNCRSKLNPFFKDLKVIAPRVVSAPISDREYLIQSSINKCSKESKYSGEEWEHFLKNSNELDENLIISHANADLRSFLNDEERQTLLMLWQFGVIHPHVQKSIIDVSSKQLKEDFALYLTQKAEHDEQERLKLAQAQANIQALEKLADYANDNDLIELLFCLKDGYEFKREMMHSAIKPIFKSLDVQCNIDFQNVGDTQLKPSPSRTAIDTLVAVQNTLLELEHPLFKNINEETIKGAVTIVTTKQFWNKEKDINLRSECVRVDFCAFNHLNLPFKLNSVYLRIRDFKI